jgi:hypothetical protein
MRSRTERCDGSGLQSLYRPILFNKRYPCELSDAFQKGLLRIGSFEKSVSYVRVSYILPERKMEMISQIPSTVAMV